MKILIINGPNLSMLGRREPDVYGRAGLDEIMESVCLRGRELGLTVDCFQSDSEGELVTRIGRCAGQVDGIIINPAAYTHTSVALRDAIKGCGVPCVEVHLSNTQAREDFRHTSFTAGVCVGQIMGFGPLSYHLALEGLADFLKRKDCSE